MPKKTESTRPTADLPPMPDFNETEVSPAPHPGPAPAATAPGESTPPASSPQAVDYGMLEALRAGQANLADSMQKFVQKLSDYLSSALDDATSLEVRTYISEDLGAVNYEKGQFTGNVRLRALTRINIDGDTLVCVPESEGELDTAVWNVHLDMVRQAQESRAELLKTIVGAASSLASMFTPKA
jgi:hypothetical protein